MFFPSFVLLYGYLKQKGKSKILDKAYKSHLSHTFSEYKKLLY